MKAFFFSRVRWTAFSFGAILLNEYSNLINIHNTQINLPEHENALGATGFAQPKPFITIVVTLPHHLAHVARRPPINVQVLCAVSIDRSLKPTCMDGSLHWLRWRIRQHVIVDGHRRPMSACVPCRSSIRCEFTAVYRIHQIYYCTISRNDCTPAPSSWW